MVAQNRKTKSIVNDRDELLHEYNIMQDPKGRI